MSDGRRMTTDRFYGGIEGRLDLLTEFLSFIASSESEENGVPEDRIIDWILEHSNAQERDAVNHHLNFIKAIDLIEEEDRQYRTTRTGLCYLRDRDPLVLYNALRTGVKGFDTILRALASKSLTDADLMDLLVSEFEECNMGTAAVAQRHREWLQAIGYVEQVDGRNQLTESGRAVADQLQGTTGADLEIGKIYQRRDLHTKFGGQVQGGIAPSNDEPVVFLFTGEIGESHGYRDEIRPDGTVIYTGEGQTGDMEMLRGNRVIRDHVEEGRELHFFSMEDAGVRYIGQYLYAGHFFEELPDAEGNPREAIRFKLAPVGAVAIPDSIERDTDEEVKTTDSDLQQFDDPTVYQVPVRTGDGPIRTNFDLTILEGIDRTQIEAIYDPPIDYDTLRVWGNRAKEPSEVGDFLLFADRDGRYGGEYTILARVAHATILDDETASAFTDAVGWGEVTDEIFPHVMFLEPVYEANLDRETFWETLGFSGWPNDTYSAINFDRQEGTFYEEYDSIREFIEESQGRQLFPNPSMPEYDSLREACDDVKSKLSETDEGQEWLIARLGKSVIEDWSRALSGFKPADEVDAATAATFDQIRMVYTSLEPKLSEKSEELRVGTLNPFSQAQTFFLGSVRTVQEEIGVSGGVLNQPRFNSVLRSAYTTTSAGEGSESGLADEHELTSYLTKTEPTLYKFTAPPDYWLTTVEYGSVSFEDRHRDRWEAIEEGDVAILHSRAHPSTDEFSTQTGGLIGVAIFGKKFEKDDLWWWDEHRGNMEFTMAATIDRLYLTGDISQIDVTRGIVEKYEEDPSLIDRELAALTANCLPIDEANTICADISQTAFPAQGMFARFRTEEGEVDYDRPLALIKALADNLTEVPTVNVHKPIEGSLTDDVDTILDGLYFPEGQGEQILEQIETSLNAGKHVLLTGPPGTGKTEIAERVCKHLLREHPNLFSDYEMTTATADWSTFDTVGGYMPTESEDTDGDLSFTPGIVLNRLKNNRTGVQSNELTIIDELNRADIDKAFGQLFTLLSGQSVQLPYTVGGEEVELTTFKDIDGPPAANQFVVPNSWRIFATMNAYDKTSLYEMSYAFMRRFAFVRVPAPALPDVENTEWTVEDVVFDYADAWELDISRDEAWAVGRVWQETNHAVEERAIGPAIVEDVLRYVNHHPESELQYHLTQAVISYIFPQLEGVPKRKQIVDAIGSVREIDSDLLEDAAQEMLQVSLAENE